MILKTLLGLAVILGGLAVCYGVGRVVLGKYGPGARVLLAVVGYVLLAYAVGSAILIGR